MSTIQYISTRDTNNRVTASQAILKGIAEDGGLYVPTALPEVTLDWEVLKTQSYQEIAIENFICIFKQILQRRNYKLRAFSVRYNI